MSTVRPRPRPMPRTGACPPSRRCPTWCPSGGPWTTCAATCWMRCCAQCRSACPGGCSSPGPGWPAVVCTLAQLPLTPNGKLDRAALPAPEWTPAMGYVAPRTATEQILADIWAQVLSVTQVGVEDNFFELGGDSILSIQVISRARRAGLSLMPRDLFVHQTVASLTANLGDQAPEVAEQGPVVGAVPLTPIQHWFFDTQADALNHLTFSMLVELAPALDRVALEAALAGVAAHPDPLRLRFEHTGAAWH